MPPTNDSRLSHSLSLLFLLLIEITVRLFFLFFCRSTSFHKFSSRPLAVSFLIRRSVVAVLTGEWMWKFLCALRLRKEMVQKKYHSWCQEKKTEHARTKKKKRILHSRLRLYNWPVNQLPARLVSTKFSKFRAEIDFIIIIFFIDTPCKYDRQLFRENR